MDDESDYDDEVALQAHMHKTQYEIHTPRFKFGQYKGEEYDAKHSREFIVLFLGASTEGSVELSGALLAVG